MLATYAFAAVFGFLIAIGMVVEFVMTRQRKQPSIDDVLDEVDELSEEERAERIREARERAERAIDEGTISEVREQLDLEDNVDD